MGLFKGIEDASATEGRNYSKAGIFDIEIKKVTVGETRKKIGFFAVDMKILGTNNEEQPIGAIVNWISMADKDSFLGNVKGFIMAVLMNDRPAGSTINAAEITEEVIEELLKDDAKDVVGKHLKLQVIIRKTGSGGEFSLHTFYPASAQVSAA